MKNFLKITVALSLALMSLPGWAGGKAICTAQRYEEGVLVAHDLRVPVPYDLSVTKTSKIQVHFDGSNASIFLQRKKNDDGDIVRTPLTLLVEDSRGVVVGRAASYSAASGQFRYSNVVLFQAYVDRKWTTVQVYCRDQDYGGKTELPLQVAP